MKRDKEHLWDHIWKGSTSKEEDIFILKKEENCIRWHRIERIVLRKFGSFNNLQVIELGAGVGTNAALMTRRKAKATVLDYSEGAIKRARSFFQSNKLVAKFLKHDALALPKDLLGKFDISMSFGLAEHFKGAKRTKIIESHFDVLKKGGMAFISVPNRFNPPYRLFKYFAEHVGRWQVDTEYPFSRKELREICKQIGIVDYSFFGDSLISSFIFVNPFINRFKPLRTKDDLNTSSIRKEKGTFLDSFLSYALVLCGIK